MQTTIDLAGKLESDSPTDSVNSRLGVALASELL